MDSEQTLSVLYVSSGTESSRDLPEVFRDALNSIAELTVYTGGSYTDQELCSLLRQYDVYLVSRHSAPVPSAIADDPGRLRLIQAAVGSLKRYVPRSVLSVVPTCNWGDAPAQEIAEGTLMLLLATLADLHHHIMTKRRGYWKVDKEYHGGKLSSEDVGLYGFGFIGRRFAEMLHAFDCTVHVFDPYAEELPSSVVRHSNLETLFDSCSIISIHAGLTPETRRSVTADLLARLPDHGVIVNTARGGIIDQSALFDELSTGRLRAGLDVLDDPDTLPEDHAARSWENLILTAHQAHLHWPLDGKQPTTLTRAQEYALKNLERLKTDQPLHWRVSESAFDRMT